MHSFSCPRTFCARLRFFAGTASALACASILTSVAAQTPVPSDTAPEWKPALQSIIVMERDHSDVMANLEYLSDMIGPRLTGSERLKQANDWTAEKMRGYGLDNVHLEPYTIPVGWERGSVEAKIIAPNGLHVYAEQMAWTPATKGTVTGPVVVFAPKTEADFTAFKGKLKNAIVLTSDQSSSPTLPGYKALPPIGAFVIPNAPEEKPSNPDAMFRRPPGNFKTMMEFRQKVSDFMEKEGVGVILRDAGKPHGLQNMTGSWENKSKLTTLFVSHEYIAMMQRLLKRGAPVTMSVKATSKFTKGPVTVYNTVGEIKGTEKPEEIVLLGAHLDSWDLGTGSTDNGTGSMAVLEAAKLVKASGVAPKRTIRFVLFSGEEEGLHGSEAYVKAHKAEMPNYDVVWVHDTGTGRVKGAWLQGRNEAKPMVESAFGLLKDLQLVADAPTLFPNKMNGTDHASFDDAGVPAFAFNQDPAEYGLTHHSQSDTFDKVRAEDLKQGACVLAVLALDAAQNPNRFPRSPAASPTSSITPAANRTTATAR